MGTICFYREFHRRKKGNNCDILWTSARLDRRARIKSKGIFYCFGSTNINSSEIDKPNDFFLCSLYAYYLWNFITNRCNPAKLTPVKKMHSLHQEPFYIHSNIDCNQYDKVP